MQALRQARFLRQFMLIWFGLTLAAAMASPLINPQTPNLICSALGGVKLAPDSAGDSSSTGHHTLDCPLCLNALLAPQLLQFSLALPSGLAHAMQPVFAALIAAATAPPLPSRGPPLVS